MLESYTGSKSRYKSSIFKMDSKNSFKDLFSKDKGVTKTKRNSKKSNKTIKGLKTLKTLDNIEIKEGRKTKFSLGEINIAKIHKEATRPLKKIKDLTKEELKNYSCPCCGLPTQIKGKLEDYKMCDSPDKFCDYGEGVILYFSFFKFCIFVTFIASIGIGLFDSYFSYNYHYDLQKMCNNLHIDSSLKDSINQFNGSNYNNISNFISPLRECQIYYIDNRINNPLLNSFIFKLSIVNFKNYKIISEIFNYLNEVDFEPPIINLNFVNFLCIISIFIIYLVYIFFIYNKSNAANYLVYFVSDYSIFLTDLNDLYKKFEKNLEYIHNKEIENNYNKLEKKIYEDKLGFEPEENMEKIDLFKKFLEKKLFIKKRKNKKEPLKYYNIKRIDLCCKLNEIICLQKEIEELDEKIERIEFDKSMIKKNNKKNIKGDKRFYYSCCLCCETEEILEKIKETKK